MRRHLLSITFLGVIIAAGTSHASAAQHEPQATILLATTPPQGAYNADHYNAGDPEGTPVWIDAQRLVNSRSVQVDLPDGRSAVFNLSRDYWLSDSWRPKNNYVWVGRKTDGSLDSLTMVIGQDHLTGSIVTAGKHFLIAPVSGSLHRLIAVDTQDEQECLVETPPPYFDLDQVGLSGNEPSIDSDDGSTIDVLVAYTQAAEAASYDIMQVVDLAVAEANTSYENSAIAQRLRLVYANMVQYPETGNAQTDLFRLREPADGYLDDVMVWRDAFCADLVTLLVETSDYCGVAYLMLDVSAAFRPNACSIVKRTCATGSYTYGHELGHNMGAHHDRYVASEPGAYAYSHGYVNFDARWRTIMAYNDECYEQGTTCPRIQYWSNPSVDYDGLPTGVPSNDPESADNALTLANTAPTVAQFRDSNECGIASGEYCHDQGDLFLLKTWIVSSGVDRSDIRTPVTGWYWGDLDQDGWWDAYVLTSEYTETQIWVRCEAASVGDVYIDKIGDTSCYDGYGCADEQPAGSGIVCADTYQVPLFCDEKDEFALLDRRIYATPAVIEHSGYGCRASTGECYAIESEAILRANGYSYDLFAVECASDSDCAWDEYCMKTAPADPDDPTSFRCSAKCGNGICDPDENCPVDGSGPEVCDGLDNDCNGEVDDGFPMNEWYRDSDSDGYGVDWDMSHTCEATPPSGYAEQAGDCDDSHSATYPGAPETNDGLDNQCSGDFGCGLIDEISDWLEFPNAANPGEFCWAAQPGALEYEVVRSVSRVFPADCLSAATSSTCWEDSETPPTGDVLYYLVHTLAPFVGSWGWGPDGERLEVCTGLGDSD